MTIVIERNAQNIRVLHDTKINVLAGNGQAGRAPDSRMSKTLEKKYGNILKIREYFSILWEKRIGIFYQKYKHKSLIKVYK